MAEEVINLKNNFLPLDEAESRPVQVAHYMLIENDKKLLNTFSFIANPVISSWEHSKKVLEDTHPRKMSTRQINWHTIIYAQP